MYKYLLKNKSRVWAFVGVILLVLIVLISVARKYKSDDIVKCEGGQWDGINSKCMPYGVAGIMDRVNNGTYNIDGQDFTLVNGTYQKDNMVINFEGYDSPGDLNADNREDIVFLLTRKTGIEPLQYFAVAMLAEGDGYKTLDALSLGNDMTPLSTEVGNGLITINFSTDGRYDLSRRFRVQNGELNEVNE